MTRRWLIGLLAGACSLWAADATPTAEQIMDKYVEVTGGKEAYAKRKSEVMTAHMEFPAAGLTAKIVRYAAEPDKYYTSMDMPGVGVVEMGVTDGIAWEKSAVMGPRIKTGAEKAEAVREAALNSTANWRKFYPKVTLAGTEKIDGEDCYKVVMEPVDGNPITQYFQKSSGLAVRMTTVTKNAQVGDVPVTVNVTDYKNFGGVWAPAKTTQKALGQEFTIVIDKVEVNAEIPEAKFAVPEDIKALAAKGAAPAKTQPATPATGAGIRP